MTRRILVVILILTAVLAAACTDDGAATAPGGGRPDSGTLVEGSGYRGVVLDAHLDHLQPADSPPIEDDVESFVPTEAEVARFEAKLPRFAFNGSA